MMKKHFILYVIGLIFTLPIYAQNRLRSTGTMSADTLKSNHIQLINGNASELLMANGTKLPAASAAGQILSINSSGTRTWTALAGANTFSLLKQANIGGTQNGLGVNTNSPTALLHVEATGNFTANNIFTVQSTGDVIPVLNSNGTNNWSGYRIDRNNVEQWFFGLPGGTNHFLIKNTTGTNSPGVGINEGGTTDALLAVNGSVRARGYYYNIQLVDNPATTVNLSLSDDYYIASFPNSTLTGYRFNLPTPASNLTGKRMIIKLIGTGSGTGLIGCNPNLSTCFRSGTNATSATQTATLGTTYIFVCDGTNWYTESIQVE